MVEEEDKSLEEDKTSKGVKALKDDITLEIKYNIERANEIVRLYENRRRIFLEINLALVTAFSLVVGFLYNEFNILGKSSLTISIVVYFVITLENIHYNLKRNQTNNIEPTICSYSRGFNIEIYSNFKKFDFKEDYEKQLKNLHKFQENYDKVATKTRSYTFNGIKWLIYLLIVSIIINTIGTWVALLFKIEL